MPDEADIYRNGGYSDIPTTEQRPKPAIEELRDRARAASPEVMRWLEALVESGCLNGRDGQPGFPGPPGTPQAGRGLVMVNGSTIAIDPEQLRPIVAEQINVIERLATIEKK